MPTTTRRAVAAIGLTTLVLASAACNPGNPDVDSLAATQGLPNLLVDLSAQDWLLDRVGTTVGLGDGPISLDFHADRTASGVAPCNAYRASVAFGDGTVTISDVKTTLRSCEPAVMQTETAFFAALTAVRDVDLTNRDRLVLTAPGGVRLAFDAFNPYHAIVRTWHVVTIAVNDALTSPPAGVDPTITFSDDGKVVVDAGCRANSGTWSLDDDRLSVASMSAMEGCPEQAASVEGAILVALHNTGPVRITPSTLTLLTPAGTIALVATAEP